MCFLFAPKLIFHFNCENLLGPVLWLHSPKRMLFVMPGPGGTAVLRLLSCSHLPGFGTDLQVVWTHLAEERSCGYKSPEDFLSLPPRETTYPGCCSSVIINVVPSPQRCRFGRQIMRSLSIGVRQGDSPSCPLWCAGLFLVFSPRTRVDPLWPPRFRGLESRPGVALLSLQSSVSLALCSHQNKTTHVSESTAQPSEETLLRSQRATRRLLVAWDSRRH